MYSVGLKGIEYDITYMNGEKVLHRGYISISIVV